VLLADIDGDDPFRGKTLAVGGEEPLGEKPGVSVDPASAIYPLYWDHSRLD